MRFLQPPPSEGLAGVSETSVLRDGTFHLTSASVRHGGGRRRAAVEAAVGSRSHAPFGKELFDASATSALVGQLLATPTQHAAVKLSRTVVPQPSRGCERNPHAAAATVKPPPPGGETQAAVLGCTPPSSLCSTSSTLASRRLHRDACWRERLSEGSQGGLLARTASPRTLPLAADWCIGDGDGRVRPPPAEESYATFAARATANDRGLQV